MGQLHMVGIVSGASLGLFSSSARTLGASSSVGTGVPGRNGESITINAATGNLIIQDQDERLSALGLDLYLVRTYNSQGVVDGDNNDNWRIGVYQRLSSLTGIRNTSGSTITKTFGDGTDVIYTYNTTLAKYVSAAGDGADDTLSWNATTSQWTWTDGSGRNTETYDWSTLSGTGKRLNSKDTDGNVITYSYTGSLLTSITDASGQVTTLTYSGNNLASIKVTQPASQGGAVQTLTRYTYDTSNRLTQVTVDLSPQDNSITDGKTFVTTYTYVGTTKQIASITQNGGTSGSGVSSVSFTYVTQNGQSRLKTYVVNDGTSARTTTFTYGGTYTTSSGTYSTVNVSDALGRVTTYNHDTLGRLTSVLSPTTSGSRIQTNYTYNAGGKVLTITEDPTGLNRVVTNTYDGNDNLLSSRDSAGNTIIRTYDANNTNQLLTETTYTGRASSGTPTGGMSTRYVYDSEFHLRFTISPDGRVTERQYDAPGKLILTRSFTGALYTGSTYTESALSTWANGQDLTKIERVDYSYDFRAQISSITAWSATTSAGAGSGTPSITRFTYDQRGQLLNTTEARGEATTSDATDYVTSYTYDGLGRLLTSTEWIAAGQTRTTSNQYDDVGNRTIITINNTPTSSLTTTSTFNKAGDLTSVITSGPGIPNGTTSYKYDADNRLLMATDPTNLQSFSVYDELGRKTGDVDPVGTLTEYVYNKADQVVKTIRYATSISSAALTSLVANTGTLLISSIRPAAAATDQIGRIVYNTAGRVQYTIDAAGAVTENVYDGAGRVTDTIAYANPVTIASTVGEVLPGSFTITPDSVNDRRARYFYGNDDQLLGTLDAAGYWTENTYDAAGRLTQTTSFANPTNTADRAAGTFATFHAWALANPDNETAIDPEQDANSYFFYDGQGRVIGQLDAEGYFTETQYDVAGHVSQTLRYDPYNTSGARVILTYTASTTFQSLKSAATGAFVVNTHSISYQYDGVGRISSETSSQGVGVNVDTITTTYQYDRLNNLISSTRAQGTSEARTTQAQYDALGRVTKELSGEGSVALAALGASPTQAQVDQVWARYGVSYTYDVAGRKASITTVAFDATNNTTQTLTSYVYYDQDGRVRFTVNAVGEVQENQYDALGQVTNTLAYANRISTTGLTGGLLTSALTTRLTPAADATHDAKVTFTYALTGQVASTTTAEGAYSTYQYNAFGEEKSRTEKIDNNRTRTSTRSYDTRGLLTSVTADTTANRSPVGGGLIYPGLKLTTTQTYDAFGRVSSVTDPMGKVSKIEHDRLGRTVATVDTLNSRRTISYDAFDRVLTSRDAFGNVTAYAYNDAQRATTIRTPEGVSVTTVANRHGQTLTVTAGGNTTSYGYNASGQMTSVSDGLGTLESRLYDTSGRLVIDTDANGASTRFGYDAANRVLTRTVDPSGLNLTTSYQFDGEGHVTRVTEANGKVTATDYDRDGRVKLIAVDPNGLNLRTQYTYDFENRVFKVTEGYGSANPLVTLYLYDTMGRRVTQYVDQGSGNLSLTTYYTYDKNGNLTQTTDPNGNKTWFAYDAANRLTVTVQAAGVDANDRKAIVTQLTYDAEGRVTSSRTYYTPIDTTSFTGTDLTATVVNGALQLQSGGATIAVSANLLDRYSQSVFDRDGRAVYSIDSLGGVVESTFDDNGNVTKSRAYANRISVRDASGAAIAYGSISAVQSALAASGSDHIAYAAYDLRGRLAFSVDATGGVTQMQYDGDGNVVQTTRYASAKTSGAMDFASLTSFAAANAGNAKNQTTRAWYDAAERIRFALDGEGFLTESRYNDLTREVSTILYNKRDSNNVAVKPVVGTGATLAQVVSAAASVASAAQDEVTTTSLDAAGRVKTVTNAMGSKVVYGYDDIGRVVTVTDGNNNTTTNTYDTAGRLLTSQSPGGVKATYTYDADSNVKTITQSFADGSDARVTSYTYDSLNRQVTVTDGEGYTTRIDYDTFGNKTAITAGLYIQSLLVSGQPAYDAAKAANAANPMISNFNYDAAGELVLTSDGEHNVTIYNYDTFGNRTAVTESAFGNNNAAARTTSYQYDSGNRVVKVTSPLGSEMRYGYDALGNRTSEKILQSAATDANGVVQRDGTGEPVNATWINRSYEFDRDGRVAAAIDPYGTRTETYYDAAGNLTEIRSAAGTAEQRSVWMEYDQNNRKTADVSYGYDAQGNIDLASRARTLYSYDAVGNQIKVTRPADATGYVAIAHYYYNADNQLKAMLDPTGAVTAYQYDSAGNRTESRVYATKYTGAISDTVAPAAISSAADRVVSTGYDRASNAITTTRTEGTAGLPKAVQAKTTYDSVGRKLTVTDYIGDGLTSRTLTFTYDADGRVKTSTDVDNTVTTFGYDGAGNTISVIVTNGTDTFNPTRRSYFKYDLNNQRVQEIIDPNTDPYTGAALRSNGAEIVRATAYDQAGNVITKSVNATVGVGTASDAYTYDLNNRQSVHTDGTGKVTSYGYDRLGNRTRVVSGNGNVAGGSAVAYTTTFVYDQNNRLKQTILPPVTTYSIGGSEFIGAQPTVTNRYDNAGNLTEVQDANGNQDTRYYDGDGHIVAEIKGTNALCTYTYNAFGEVSSKSEYMTFLTGASHNPQAKPTPPAGDVRTTTYDYDLQGRLILVTLPAVEVTKLTGTDSHSPSVASRTTPNLTERHDYDAYGDEVATYDRAGNRTLHYYDVKHREVGQVDALGYLVEWSYDAVGNRTQQRQYMGPTGGAGIGLRPAAPSGVMNQTDWRYDAASRLVMQIDPAVDVDVPSASAPTSPGIAAQLRRVTAFSYDQAGNLKMRTVASGTPNQQTEFYYYDGAGCRVGMIDANRVLTAYYYDANGNMVRQARYYGSVGVNVNIATVAWSYLQALPYDPEVTLSNRDSSRDQVSDFQYDAADRLIKQTDRMVFQMAVVSGQLPDNMASDSNPSDDLTKIFKYDGNGNRTWETDEDGYKKTLSYDAAGRVTQTIIQAGHYASALPNPETPNATLHFVGTSFEYDAVGNLVRTYTGTLYTDTFALDLSAASVATDLKVTQTDGVTSIGFNAGAKDVQAYVVYGTSSQTSLDGYSARSPSMTVPDGGGAISVPLKDLVGGKYFFRVVTVDSAGNLAWTDEQTFIQPAKITDIYVLDDTVNYEWLITFDSAVLNPRIVMGYPGNLNVTVPLTVDTIYSDYYPKALYATSAMTNGNEYVVQWDDAFGNTYTSEGQPLFTSYGSVVTTNTTSQSAVSVNGVSGFAVASTISLPVDTYWGFTSFTATWVSDSNPAISGSVTVARVPGAVGAMETYVLNMGSTTPLAAGKYHITISGAASGNRGDQVLDSYDFVVGGDSAGSVTQQAYSWTGLATDEVRKDTLVTMDNPNPGAQTFIPIGEAIKGNPGRLIIHIPTLPPTDYFHYIAAYGHFVPEKHSLSVAISDPAAATTDVTFTVTLSASELAQVDQQAINLYVYDQYQTDFSDGHFVVNGNMVPTATPGVFTFTAHGVTAGRFSFGIGYDVKNKDAIYFASLPADYATYAGNFNVFMNTSDGNKAFSGRSFVEVDDEFGGIIWRNAYGQEVGESRRLIGDVVINQPTGTKTLALSSTGLTGGSRVVNGLSSGYYIESKYDALNNRIASNGPDGLYREYGYDENGNVVETRLYGKGDIAHYGTYGRADTSFTDGVIATYATYDARNRKTADFGALTQTPFGISRAVSRYTYDALNNVKTRLTDASVTPWSFTYNAYGQVITETNPLNQITRHRYDILGRETQITTARDGTVVDGVTLNTTVYKYYGSFDQNGNFQDGHGALQKVRDAVGNETGLAYDLFGRMIAKTDGRGMATLGDPNDFTTLYTYDNRDRLVAVQAADAYQIANDSSSVFAAERQALGFSAAPIAANFENFYKIFTTQYKYDGRNNRKEQIDAAGTQWEKTADTEYDAMNRPWHVRISWPGVQSQDTYRQYDDYGNLLRQVDGERNSKQYSYGAFGRLDRQIDEDSYQTVHLYDDFGREYNAISPQDPALNITGPIRNIWKTYDDAGHILTIDDYSTGVATKYTYDLLGNRATEVITTPAATVNVGASNLLVNHNRNISYTYDQLGRMTRWADSVSGAAENYEYDADGNCTRVYDDGVDPTAFRRGQDLAGASDYHRLDHSYVFDAAGRVSKEVDNAANSTIASYQYDAAGNRALETLAPQGGPSENWVYLFDASNHLMSRSGSKNGTPTREQWTYLPDGSIRSYAQYLNGASQAATQTTYDYHVGDPNSNPAYRLSGPVDVATTFNNGNVDNITITQRNRAGYVTALNTITGNTTTSYAYANYSDGRVKTITTTILNNNTKLGTSQTWYDANKVAVRVDRGKGSGQTRNEIETFIIDNEGHILYKSHDDGKSASLELRDYLYANGQPVGEFGQTVEGKETTLMDTGAYSRIPSVGANNPAAQSSTHVVRTGETLQSVAAMYYGNPSLWYVIAEANHLDSSVPLQEGQVLTIPSTLSMGQLDAYAHSVYNQGSIIGSQIPDLTLPPPPTRPSQCAAITAIIVAVVIAVVVAVVTYGVGSALSGAIIAAVGAQAGGLAAGAITVGTFAAVGAAAAAVGNVANQGFDIAIGAQTDRYGNVSSKFNWNGFAASAAAGALSGAAAGVGAAGNTLAGLGQLDNLGALAIRSSSAVLQAGSATTGELIANHGKISNVSSIIFAGLGGYAGASASIAAGAGMSTAASAFGQLSLTNAFVSPWISASESAMRNRGPAADNAWLGALQSNLISAGGVLFGAIASLFGGADGQGSSGSESNLSLDQFADRVDVVDSLDGALADNSEYAGRLNLNDGFETSSSASDFGIGNVPSNAHVRMRVHVVTEADEILERYATDDATFSSIISGFAESGVRAFSEPALQMFDVGQAIGVGIDALDGTIDNPNVQWQSGMFRGIEQGESAWAVIPRQIPIISIPYAAWDLGQTLGSTVMAAYDGNWNAVAKAAGSLAGGLAQAALGKSLSGSRVFSQPGVVTSVGRSAAKAAKNAVSVVRATATDLSLKYSPNRVEGSRSRYGKHFIIFPEEGADPTPTQVANDNRATWGNKTEANDLDAIRRRVDADAARRRLIDAVPPPSESQSRPAGTGRILTQDDIANGIAGNAANDNGSQPRGPGGGGGGGGTVDPENPGTYLFRGDSRSPDQVFLGDRIGFEARGKGRVVDLPALRQAISIFMKPEENPFVQTSTSPRVARKFAAKEGNGWVYTIREQKLGYDVNRLFPNRPHGMSEREIAVPYGIAREDILGARQVDKATGKFIPGSYVRNPYYGRGPGGGVPGRSLDPSSLLLPANAGGSHYFGNPVTLLNKTYGLFEGIEGAGAPRVFRDVSGEFRFANHPDFGYGTMYRNPPTNYDAATYLFWQTEGNTKTFGDVVARDPGLRAEGVTGRSLFYSAMKYFGNSQIKKFKFDYGGSSSANLDLSMNFKRYWEERSFHLTAEEAAMRVPSARALWEMNFKRVEVLKESNRSVFGYYHRDGAYPTFRSYSFANNWVDMTGARIDQFGNVSLPWWNR